MWFSKGHHTHVGFLQVTIRNLDAMRPRLEEMRSALARERELTGLERDRAEGLAVHLAPAVPDMSAVALFACPVCVPCLSALFVCHKRMPDMPDTHATCCRYATCRPSWQTWPRSCPICRWAMGLGTRTWRWLRGMCTCRQDTGRSRPRSHARPRKSTPTCARTNRQHACGRCAVAPSHRAAPCARHAQAHSRTRVHTHANACAHVRTDTRHANTQRRESALYMYLICMPVPYMYACTLYVCLVCETAAGAIFAAGTFATIPPAATEPGCHARTPCHRCRYNESRSRRKRDACLAVD